MSSQATRNAYLFFGALTALTLQACSSGSSGSGVPAGPTTFASMLDRAQEIPAPTSGTRIRVTVTNLAPALGTFQTPVWFGFQDGQFDLYDQGSPASVGIERIAEDGTVGPLSDLFTASGFGTTQGVFAGSLGPAAGPIPPGETVSRIFELDPNDPQNAFFNYASMVIPSNDAFIANGNPQAHPIFDGGGNFVASDFVVTGPEALDAGTEVNDELPANTAFFGQATPDTGVDEGGNVTLHPGFGTINNNILSDAMFTGADFTALNYDFLSFRFEELTASTAPTFGVAEVDLVGAQVQFDISATGLSGDVIGAHFHEAPAGMTGPVVLDLTDEIDSNGGGEVVIRGLLPVTLDFITALRAGDIYLNLHTELNPAGEIRGQMATGAAFTGALSTTAEIPAPIAGTGVRVTVTNNAPDLGTFQTPLWVGFHNGMFDIYDQGSSAATFFPITNALERLAEDGSVGPINEAFTTMAFGTTQDVLTGLLAAGPGPIAPGETVSQVFQLDPMNAANSYFSYASMIIPSNDAFIANGSPLAHEIFDVNGNFTAADFVVTGAEALDAGTETNDEVPANTAFFGQMNPDTGNAEGGNVTLHPGFGTINNNILTDAMFTGADFTAMNYDFLDVRFSEVAAGPAATGTVFATLDMAQTQITFSITARDLSGDVTMMHFHEAPAGMTGPVVLDIASSIAVNDDGMLIATGTENVPMSFITALEAGEIYLNVHTGLNPAGEIRAQVVLQ